MGTITLLPHFHICTLPHFHIPNLPKHYRQAGGLADIERLGRAARVGSPLRTRVGDGYARNIPRCAVGVERGRDGKHINIACIQLRLRNPRRVDRNRAGGGDVETTCAVPVAFTVAPLASVSLFIADEPGVNSPVTVSEKN